LWVFLVDALDVLNGVRQGVHVEILINKINWFAIEANVEFLFQRFPDSLRVRSMADFHLLEHQLAVLNVAPCPSFVIKQPLPLKRELDLQVSLALVFDLLKEPLAISD
jgi:hypothetical protein